MTEKGDPWSGSLAARQHLRFGVREEWFSFTVECMASDQMKLRREPLNAQEAQVIRLCDEGLSFAEIGRQMGFSGVRARDVEMVARERLRDFAENAQGSLLLLPVRARKFLERFDLTLREDVLAAINAGELAWDEEQKRLRYGRFTPHHYGWSVWQVLCEWAGLPRPESSRHCVTCPHCGGKVPV